MRIQRTSVTEQVVEFLRKNIEDGTWPVGEKIPSENMLTDSLGVSRTSVRVAIQQLIGIGALKSIHGKGTFVKTNNLGSLMSGTNGITAEDCRDIAKVLEFRSILEPGTCYLAVQNMTEDLLNTLRYHLGKMQDSIGNRQEFIRHDIMFHTEISKASGNHLLVKSLQEVFEQSIINQNINEVFGYKDGIYYHTLLLKAMEDGKANTARNLMYEHMKQAIERLEIQI